MNCHFCVLNDPHDVIKKVELVTVSRDGKTFLQYMFPPSGIHCLAFVLPCLETVQGRASVLLLVNILKVAESVMKHKNDSILLVQGVQTWFWWATVLQSLGSACLNTTVWKFLIRLVRP